MTTQNKGQFTAIDETALDGVSGGLQLGLLRLQQGGATTPALGAPSPYGLQPNLGLQPIGLTGGLPFAGGGDLVGFSQGAVQNVNNAYTPLENHVVATNRGDLSMAQVANELARSTGGAIAYAGDRNRDGLVGAEDFLHRRGVNEYQAMQQVGAIMNSLHTFEQASYGQTYAAQHDPYRPNEFDQTLNTINNVSRTISSVSNAVSSIDRIFDLF